MVLVVVVAVVGGVVQQGRRGRGRGSPKDADLPGARGDDNEAAVVMDNAEGIHADLFNLYYPYIEKKIDVIYIY
jgi:hypothetical protein